MTNPSYTDQQSTQENQSDKNDTLYDIFIIGGGVNGCGIARDAAGRGLKVALAEKGDLAEATSSKSSKLFHGGLRYLEFAEFRLVKEALQEREVLLKAMPHIAFPMRFVLPLSKSMKFETNTPIGKLLKIFMPWLKGSRPAWVIRFGLFLYDILGKREILPATSKLNLKKEIEGAKLKDEFKTAFEYSDVWVDDARLVALNAMDAAQLGANIMTRAKVSSAKRIHDHWGISVEGQGTFKAKTLVNAGGPWVADIVSGVVRMNSTESVRLVRGSHIITKKLFDHDKAYFLQGSDGRIIFFLPYETDFTMIGTTEAEHKDDPLTAQATQEEKSYLIDFANRYLKDPISTDDIVHSFAGVRPLYEDGASSATAATREYVLSLETNGAPLLNVFGGKITSYRKLSESVLNKLSDHLPIQSSWTSSAPLPGAFEYGTEKETIAHLLKVAPYIDEKQAKRLVLIYGTNATKIFDGLQSKSEMGQNFGHDFYEAELKYLVKYEFVKTTEDAIWRRTKIGLRMDSDQIANIDAWFQQNIQQ